MDQSIADAIERFSHSLATLGIQVRTVVLFGSHATGAPDEHSDIDLAVISDDFKGMDILKRLETVGLALARARIMEPIEALAYTQEEYDSKREGTFVGDEVKPKGVAIASATEPR